jgi:hypothetical protein
MSAFHPDAEEAIPQDCPMERGNGVVTSCFVDADQAGCKATRRSHTGVIQYVNMAPILWYSKRQNTIETLTFGSDFCAITTTTIDFSRTSVSTIPTKDSEAKRMS